MHISSSMMQTAKSCWKKYEWHYEMNLEPVEQRPALHLGKVVHEAFEMYYKGFKPVEIRAFIDTAFAEQRSLVELTEAEDVDIAHATAVGMWEGFPKDKESFQEMYPEKEFCIPYNGITIDGSMDGLLKKDGRWWVREMKTTSLNRRQFKERMDVSEQASLYVWAARKLGFDVSGVMYDAIHKPLLRKGANETAASFCERIVQDYHSRPDIYFQREYIYRNPVDMKHFETDLDAFHKDLMAKRKSGEFYRNHGSCVAFNSTCQYKKICFEEKPDVLTLQLFYKQREEGRNNGKRRNEQAAAE